MKNFVKICFLLLCVSSTISKNVYTPVLVQTTSQPLVQTADFYHA